MSATVLKLLLPFLFIAAIILYAASIIIGRTVEGIFIFELLMMVLPYLLLLNALLLAGLLYMIISRRYSFVSLHVGIPFLILLVVTVAMGYWIYDFSYVKSEQIVKKEVLKVAFFNKLYENKNYEAMRNSIKSSNPDVIGLSEVTNEDIAPIKHIELQDTYRYTYTKPYRFHNLMILSKYPLTIEQIPNAPDTLAAQATISGKKYVFIVAHPDAVLNPHTLLGRNKELQMLNHYLNAQKNANLVLLGDINTSPWSSSYIKFTSNLHGFKNAAKGSGLSSTWNLGPLITHIDHILVSGNLQVQSYASIPVKGSDHNLQFATLSGT